MIDEDPWEAARAMCDKHIPKMTVESAQILSTVHRKLDGTKTIGKTKKGRKRTYWVHDNPVLDKILYKSTHPNHPSTIWAGEGAANYYWLLLHFYALGSEFEYRFGKKHLSITKLANTLWTLPKNIPDGSTPMRLAMPDMYHDPNPVVAYRNFYKFDKPQNMDVYWIHGREKPEWFNV